MIFTATRLEGAYVIAPEPLEDERGFFARSYCSREFMQAGLAFNFVQCNISFNRQAGTLRGMHYQAAPHAECKLVRCTMGAIYDVIVDLRPASATFRHWFAVELTSGNRKMLYAPAGFAHGFQALQDDTEVFYQMSAAYHPESAQGIRWDDPAIGIQWPLTNPVLSARDLAYAMIRA